MEIVKYIKKVQLFMSVDTFFASKNFILLLRSQETSAEHHGSMELFAQLETFAQLFIGTLCVAGFLEFLFLYKIQIMKIITKIS
jgi:hypothetical protein